jgi:hypothetical protein
MRARLRFRELLMKTPLAIVAALWIAAPAEAQAPYVHRLDTASKITAPNGYGTFPSISADGNYVTFQSTSTDLMPGAKLGFPAAELYRRDLRTHALEQVNLDGAGGRLQLVTDAMWSAPGFLSEHGRYVTMASTSVTPHFGDLDARSDIYLRDMQLGVTEWLSPFVWGTAAVPAHVDPSLSGDGRFVVYLTQMEPWAQSKDQFDAVILCDRVLGTSTLVDRLIYPAASLNKVGYQRQPLISLDGSTVAFMVPVQTGVGHYFLRTYDVGTGALTSYPEVRNTQYTNGTFSISGDGQLIAFESRFGLLPIDSDPTFDIYVLNRGTQALKLVTDCVDSFGNASSFTRPSISPDGRYVSFAAFGNCYFGSAYDRYHMYVADLTTGLVTLESINDLGVPGDVVGSAKHALSTSAFNLSNQGGRITFYGTYANLAAPPPAPTSQAIPNGIYLRECGTTGPQLTVNNLFAGQTAVVQIDQCAPSAQVLVGVSTTGQGPMPSYWGLVSLSPPVHVYPAIADTNGQVQWPAAVPAGLKGVKVWVHGVDLTASAATTPFTGNVR